MIDGLKIAAWIVLGALLIAAQPPEGEDPHRRRSTLYVAARASGEVRVFSRDTLEEIATVPVGRRPAGLAARRDGDRIYVANAGAHAVQVIDGATRTLLETTDLPHGAAPSHLVLSGDEKTLFVASTGVDAVHVLDAASLRQSEEIAVGRRPIRLAISPDGRRLYVLCAASARVDIVDLRDLAVRASVPVGSQPTDLAVDRRTGTLYVAGGAPVLHVIDEGGARARTVPLDAPAEALAVDAASGVVATAHPLSGRVALVSGSTGAVARLARAAEISRVALDPEGRRLYALSARRGVLLVVDRIVGTVEREVPAGKEPCDLVLVP